MGAFGDQNMTLTLNIYVMSSYSFCAEAEAQNAEPSHSAAQEIAPGE